MKKLLLPLVLLSLAACRQQTKTSTEKFTDTQVRDTTPGMPAAATIKDTITKAPSANDTINPGKSIGHISLNEKTADVIAALGKPDAEDAAMGKAMLTWNSKPTMNVNDTIPHTIKIFTSTNFGGKDEASRVKHIRVTSPFFKTAEGVGCGSTIAFIKMQYKDIKKPAASYTDKSGKKVMIYDKDGIAFEIDENTKCVGITVHKPGEKAWETYISEFGDVEHEK